MINSCTDDGFISAKDLELSMGRGADVKQMIAAADKNGDGKVREPRQVVSEKHWGHSCILRTAYVEGGSVHSSAQPRRKSVCLFSYLSQQPALH